MDHLMLSAFLFTGGLTSGDFFDGKEELCTMVMFDSNDPSSKKMKRSSTSFFSFIIGA